MLEPFLRAYTTATLPGADLVGLARRHENLVAPLKERNPSPAVRYMREHMHEDEEATAAVGADPALAKEGSHR